jgi:isocitrate/isopropylmalate dehydrogenase
LRKHYDLFANIRPAKSYPGLPALYKDVDLIIVRENNEGFPPDRKRRPRKWATPSPPRYSTISCFKNLTRTRYTSPGTDRIDRMHRMKTSVALVRGYPVNPVHPVGFPF